MVFPGVVLFFHLARYQDQIQANRAWIPLGCLAPATDDDRFHAVFWKST